MSKALTVLIAISMLIIVTMPIANAIQTDKIYVGTTGAIGGYNTYDYDAQRYGDYIVWIRALDIYDDLGNVAPDGSVKGEDSFYDPAWLMVQQISTGETWNATPDFDAGLRVSPNIYYHIESISIYNNKVIYENSVGITNTARTLFMYNITTGETWDIPTQEYYTNGYEHMIYGDWIYYTTFPLGREIYVYNYDTREGRRIDGGATSNSNLGMNDEFMWFSDRTGSPDIMKIYSIETGKLTRISGVNVGLNIYGCQVSSEDGQYLGIYTDNGVDTDSYILDLEGMNITSLGADETIYWENIATENIIVVDDSDSYDSYAPYTDGLYAIYNYDENDYDIKIYYIGDNQTTVFTNSSSHEILSDYYRSVILYNTNQNSFTKNNDATDDFDIYRSESDTENISTTIIEMIPFILIMLVVGVILGAFALFGATAGYGGGML